MYLLGLVVPISVFFCLWRVFITNNTPRVLSLDIHETCSSFVPKVSKQTSPGYLFCYFLTCATTFVLGLFVSKAFQVLQEILNGFGVTYLVVPVLFDQVTYLKICCS